ncbi:MAG: hypothetical protein PVI23_13555 [Maricaulaceae bacterium]|jgi:hypothetical protein
MTTARGLLAPSIIALMAAGLAVGACERLRPAPDEPGVFERMSENDASRVVIDRTDGQRTDEGDPTPSTGTRTITPPATAEVASAAGRLFPGDLAERFAGAPVPVLAPGAISPEQARRFAETFRPTPDGFFARIGYDAYDVVVNGTRVYATPPPAAEPITARRMSDLKVSESETGLSVTFSMFGADYSLDFVCRGAGEEESADCVGEEAAAEIARNLVPVGGGQ